MAHSEQGHCDLCNKYKPCNKIKLFPNSKDPMGSNTYMCEPCMHKHNVWRMGRNLDVSDQYPMHKWEDGEPYCVVYGFDCADEKEKPEEKQTPIDTLQDVINQHKGSQDALKGILVSQEMAFKYLKDVYIELKNEIPDEVYDKKFKMVLYHLYLIHRCATQAIK